MAYLDIWQDEYDELDGVVEATNKHRARMDTDLLNKFIEEAKSITSVHNSSHKTFEFVAGHPHSNGASRMTIRLLGGVEQDGGLIDVSATISQLPADVCRAEAVVRALTKELQARGCSHFEVWGRPGEKAGISAIMSPSQE